MLHNRDLREALGAPVGTVGIYKAIVTMLFELFALYAARFLLFTGAWALASVPLSKQSHMRLMTHSGSRGGVAYRQGRSKGVEPEALRALEIHQELGATEDAAGHCRNLMSIDSCCPSSRFVLNRQSWIRADTRP